jgi:ribosomal protein L16 Arg81 hydroxylase
VESQRNYPEPPNAATVGATSPEQVSELRRLLAPLEPHTFVEQYWGRKPVHIRGTSAKFAELFDTDRFHEAVRRATSRGVRSFRLGVVLPPDVYDPLGLTSTEQIGADDIDRWLAQGNTICANDIGAGDERLARFAETIRSQLMFTGRVRFNCYLSPDGSGADTHFDARVATTLQISGRKRWRFGERPAVDWPLSNGQVRRDGTAAWMSPLAGLGDLEGRRVDESEFTEVVLEPGDVLILPAGTWHNAKAIGSSLALNLTFTPMRFLELLLRAAESELLADPNWRAGVPPVLRDDLPKKDHPPAVLAYVEQRLDEFRGFAGTLRDTSVAALWNDIAR